MIYRYIYQTLYSIIRYAKKKFNKCIERTRSSESNRSREGTESRTKSRDGQEDFGRIRGRIRACKRNILQSQRCKKDTENTRGINTLSLFLIFSIGFLISTDIFTRLGLYYGIRTIWG